MARLKAQLVGVPDIGTEEAPLLKQGNIAVLSGI
jgi:hypothetical protein